MRVTVLLGGPLLLLVSLACQAPGADERAAVSAAEPNQLLARAAALELDTVYVPPPGNALEHHTSGFAKILCSAVFITGLDEDFAAENIGYFTSPYAERARVTERIVDREKQEVRLTLPSGVTRIARYLGDQGCVTLPIGEDDVQRHAGGRREHAA